MKNQENQIRFGIMCNGFHFPAWQIETIKKLLAERDVKLELLIFDNSKKEEPSPTPVSNNPSLFWRFYKKYYVNKKSKAFKIQDCSALLNGIPSINCQTSKSENIEIFDETDIEKIQNRQLDFILKFGFGNFGGKILEAAKHGIWVFQHGDVSKYDGKISCFWEIYNEDLVTGAALKRLTNLSDQEIILKEGFLKTDLFYPKNIDRIHFESTGWPLQLCVDIRNKQFDNLSSLSKKKNKKAFFAPSDLELIIFFFIQAKIFFKKAYKTLFITDYWNVGVAKAPIQAFLDPQNLPEVKWFPNLPKNKFIADPFGIFYKDELHIIYEDFLFQERIGTTAALQFKNDEFKDNGIVIKEDFHMSYPFVFEKDGDHYCIPETYQANQVRLYKAIEFSKKWKLDRVLIENYAGVDNTLVAHEGLWWLFSTDKKSGAHHNLNIFYSDDIFEGWKRHPKNPVKTDIRAARPAGTIFEYNGEKYRPSMDYSEKVEGRIVINKILKLTKTDFKEEKSCTINPYTNTYFSDKIHTLSETGSFTIIDGAKELFVLGNIHALKYKLISLIGKLRK
jgi:hypothetical protein